MDAPSLLEFISGAREAARAAKALIDQAAATEAVDLRLIGQAKRSITQSRALLAQVEILLRPNLGPSRSGLPVAPPQDPPALAQHD